jgi:non-homologous end joining protein Ku
MADVWRPDTVGITTLRKLIEFDDDTFAKLKQLARDRMGTLQELADEAFADLMKKHGIPIDLKDALKKSRGKKRRVGKRDSAQEAAAEKTLSEFSRSSSGRF